jgi:hypothetical protein
MLEKQVASIFKVGDSRFLCNTANQLPTTQCHIPEDRNFTGYHISTRTMEYKRHQATASKTSSSPTFKQNPNTASTSTNLMS